MTSSGARSSTSCSPTWSRPSRTCRRGERSTIASTASSTEDAHLNGAQALVETAVLAGVDVCFANPGTTEMPLVEALDAQPAIRPVLGVFEGVVTGAADGYGRMTGRAAMTLLHLGPGAANGIANLHNARRAGTPLLKGHASRTLTDLGAPVIDWQSLSRAYGVPATRATTAEEMTQELEGTLGEPGPHLVELVLP